MKTKIKVVHYLNQFFAGVGGEEKANQAVCVKEGPMGPGRLLQQILGDEGEVVRTVYCGDDYFVEHTDESVREILRTVRETRPDVFIAGPAFNAGRYGTACAVLSRRVKADLRIPSLTGLYRENPGVEMCRAVVPVIPTSEAASQMRDALTRLARLASKLGRGEALGRPDEEGYLPHGQRLNQRHEKSGAERAITMLLKKVKGKEYTSEIPVPDFGSIVPAPRFPPSPERSSPW